MTVTNPMGLIRIIVSQIGITAANPIDKTRSVGREKGNSKITRPGNNRRYIRNINRVWR